MRACSYLLCVCSILLCCELHLTQSQTAYCMFGRTGINAAVNGLYTFRGATKNGKNVYQYDGSATCSGTRYLFWTGSTWRINTDYTSAYQTAYCTSNSADITQCDGQWNIINDDQGNTAIDSNMRVYVDKCPEWQCDAITTSLSGNCGGPFASHIAVNHYEDDNGLAFYYHRAFSSWACGPFTQDWCYSVSFNAYTVGSAVWQPATMGNSVGVTFVPSSAGTINCLQVATTTTLPPTTTTLSPTTTTLPTPFPTVEPTTPRPTITTLPPNVPTVPTAPSPVDIDVSDKDRSDETPTQAAGTTNLFGLHWLMIVALCIASVCCCGAVAVVIRCMMEKQHRQPQCEDVDDRQHAQLIEMPAHPLSVVANIHAIDSESDFEEKRDAYTYDIQVQPGAGGPDLASTYQSSMSNRSEGLRSSVVAASTAGLVDEHHVHPAQTQGLEEDEFEVVDDDAVTAGDTRK